MLLLQVENGEVALGVAAVVPLEADLLPSGLVLAPLELPLAPSEVGVPLVAEALVRLGVALRVLPVWRPAIVVDILEQLPFWTILIPFAHPY
jgi:hypothetical protein